jgi:hypothetical protein
MPKILGIIQGCNECPKKQYLSGGIYECSIARFDLDKNERIPGWCPLPDHPAALMAAQAARIIELERALAASDRSEGE